MSESNGHVSPSLWWGFLIFLWDLLPLVLAVAVIIVVAAMEESKRKENRELRQRIEQLESGRHQ